jgi:DNA-binding response OmpR family regulator
VEQTRLPLTAVALHQSRTRSLTVLIVLIDDEPDMHNIVKSTLQPEGYSLKSAYNGIQGLELVQKHKPTVVLIDVHLPDMKGWDICQRIRVNSNVPIIMISADDPRDDDLIHALEIGADEYLNKPLRSRLFMAHLRAVIRSRLRPRRESNIVYEDDYLSIDLDQEQVRVKGIPVQLSKLEFELLELLVENKNRPVSPAEIIRELWPDSINTPDSNHDYASFVRIYINRVRAHIEPDQRKPKYITNIRGRGYRFNTFTT